jgi:hypothetical protein
VQRHVPSVVAADVAGYSRLMHNNLMHNNEEAMHIKLTTLLADGVEPAIAEHVEAVRAALQFQTLAVPRASGRGRCRGEILGMKIHKNGKHEIGKIGSTSSSRRNELPVRTESEVEQEDSGAFMTQICRE